MTSPPQILPKLAKKAILVMFQATQMGKTCSFLPVEKLLMYFHFIKTVVLTMVQ